VKNVEKVGQQMLRELKSLIGFLTIIPTSMDSMESISKPFFLCPLVALIIGVIAGVGGWGFQFFLDPVIAGFLVLAIIQVITGFHHLDGLLDLSDAIMVRGEPAKRLEVMHDKFTGAAAICVGITVLLLTGFSFGYFEGLDLLRVVLVSEILAKEGMVLTAYFGKASSYEGMGYYIVESAKKNPYRTLFSLVLSAVMVFSLLYNFPIFTFASVMVAAVISAVLLAAYANKAFGAVTGDVLGATNELIRMVSLIVVLAIV
jgi:adenosylcobinamide-GDP ribazoletransferase